MKLFESIQNFFRPAVASVDNMYQPINSYYDQNWNFQNFQDTHYNIYNQRVISFLPEVMLGVEEIMNEIIVDNAGISSSTVDVDDLISHIYIFNPNQQNKLYNIIKQFYIDGEIYLVKLSKEQINEILDQTSILFLPAPKFDYYWVPVDPVEVKFQQLYNNPNIICRICNKNIEVDKANVIYQNFGLVDGNGENFGYLRYAIKYANQLHDLQDMIIPLRLKRSLSRRVFKIDVGNLPDSDAEKYVNSLRDKFKYKRWYNTDTGKIESSGETVSLVEDYYLTHRGNENGVDIDTLAENKSSSEDLEDILFINKKLYQSLFIPQRRVDPDYEYSVSSAQIDNEERRFGKHIDKIVNVCECIFKQISLDLYGDDDVSITRRATPQTIEHIRDGIDLLDSIKPYIGTVFTLSDVAKICFNKTIEEINSNKQRLANDISNEWLSTVFEVVRE